MSGDELTFVEQPLIDQLVSMGWTHVEGSKWHPGERASFRDVALEGRMRAAVRRINVDDSGCECLDEDRVSQAVSALTAVPPGAKLIEANQHVTKTLLKGTVVPGVDGWDGGRDRTLDFVDWEHPERNDFLVISQFRVDEPGGQAKSFIAPDVVLFVNGIPVVVIEAKSPYVADPVPEAINQLRRYSNQRPDVSVAEGNERLFWSNQFVVATCFDEARVASFTAGPEHFLEWKDTAPVPKETVADNLGKPVDHLSSQELLVAGMLRPELLLDLIRHFTLFMTLEGQTIKAVARYQQFRGVQRAVERVRTGMTRAEDGEHDRRGGVIWHTQGSGKSLTMVFLVRKMRSDLDLRRFKIVVVTDRTDLQDQLSATAELSGETVTVSKSATHLKTVLGQTGPGLVMAMIQKYLDEDTGTDRGLVDDSSSSSFEALNDDEAILVLVDEAHRSHTSTLHANLLAALPNCARIGFTGTPIIMGAKKRTAEIFGPFIDTYTLTESEADESTVPILYEGRTADGEVFGASDLDMLFEDMFAYLTAEQVEALQRKYATQGNVLEAPEMIRAKAKDMLRHYVGAVMPQGLKGIVVATSRQAVVTYRQMLLEAKDDLVAELESRSAKLADLSGDEIDKLGRHDRFLARAHRQLDLLRELDFMPVISGAHNDDPTWQAWTDPTRHRVHINQFKLPLGPAGERTDPTAMLIVKSMLLTGFDAPVAQAIYLDRKIREAELLQAIARVNRTTDGKDYGLVVDYFGVATHLSEALAAYSQDEIEGALRSLRGEVDKLDGRHQRLRQFFVGHGIEPADTAESVEESVLLLEDMKLRARFDVDLKNFLISLDTVLPRPEALPYVADAKLFGRIQVEVRQRYRDTGDGGFNPGLYREKVRQLIDEHIGVLDLTQKIPPVRITDAAFKAKVAGLTGNRAKASEMEHAVRHQIRERFDEDPARYRKLSERLDEILDRLEGQWDQLVLALEDIVEDATSEPTDDGTGLDPKVEGPFHGVLVDELNDPDPDQQTQLIAVTHEIVDHVRAEVALVGFWSNPVAQDTLRRWLVRHLDDTGLYSLEACAPLADRLVELARANHHHLTGP